MRPIDVAAQASSSSDSASVAVDDFGEHIAVAGERMAPTAENAAARACVSRSCRSGRGIISTVLAQTLAGSPSDGILRTSGVHPMTKDVAHTAFFSTRLMTLCRPPGQ